MVGTGGATKPSFSNELTNLVQGAIKNCSLLPGGSDAHTPLDDADYSMVRLG